jgi:hypothetical protein
MKNDQRPLQAENQGSSASNEVSHQAIGGDTLLYNANNKAGWLDTVKDPKNWRIICLTKLKKLDALPGLENYGLEKMNEDQYDILHEKRNRE